MVPANSSEDEWLKSVAVFAARHLNSLIHSEMVVGLAWGTTIDAISRHLTPKRCLHVDIVQLNGSGNVYAINNFYIAEIHPVRLELWRPRSPFPGACLL